MVRLLHFNPIPCFFLCLVSTCFLSSSIMTLLIISSMSSHTITKSITLSSFTFVVRRLLVISPFHFSLEPFITINAFLFNMFARIFPFSLCVWGSPLTKYGPSLLLASICIYINLECNFALRISTSSALKKNIFSSTFQFSCGP